MIVTRDSRRELRKRIVLDARVSSLEPLREGAVGGPTFVVTGGRTLNIAKRGLGIHAQSTFAVGQRVLVEIALRDRSLVECAGKVVWETTDAEGECFIGVELDEPAAALGKLW